jgi:hypothetical protein
VHLLIISVFEEYLFEVNWFWRIKFLHFSQKLVARWKCVSASPSITRFNKSFLNNDEEPQTQNFLSVVLQPKLFFGRPIFEVHKSHKIRHTPGRTPVNGWSSRCRSHHLHNTHKRRNFMPPTGLEQAIPAIEQLHTYALDRTATGIGESWNYSKVNGWVSKI